MCLGHSITLAERVHRIMFALGVLTLIVIWRLKVLTWDAFLAGLPIAAVIAGSYFWIRLDIWRSNKTIKELSNSGEVSNESIKRDLISQRVDSRAAILWLVVATVAQAFLLVSIQSKFIFVGTLLVFVPVTNWIARYREKKDFAKFCNA